MPWRPGDRARLLRRFAAAVDADSRGAGRTGGGQRRPRASGTPRWEAGNVRDVIEFYAGAPERHSGRQIPVPGGLDVTFHEPLGVVGIIVPWNFPMAIAGWGFAPALAAGNTVVLKPAELTPLERAAHRRAGARGRTPRGRAADPAGQGQRGGGALRGPSRRAQGLLHRLDRGGAQRHGRLRPADQAGDARARRQERQHRLRRRRPRAGGGPGALRRVRQRGAGLLRPLADPGASASRLRALHGAARAGGGRRRRSAIRRSRRRRWAR